MILCMSQRLGLILANENYNDTALITGQRHQALRDTTLLHNYTESKGQRRK